MNVYKAASQRHLLSSEQLKALVKKNGCHQIKNCCPLKLANSKNVFCFSTWITYANRAS